MDNEVWFDLAFDMLEFNEDNNLELLDFSDAELLQELNAFEEQEPILQPPMVTQPLPPAAPVPVSTGPPSNQPQAAKKRRFARCSEEDLISLEEDRHEKKTKDNTAWAVRLFKGNRNITK